MTISKEVKDFFGVEVERDALFKAPACFRFDNQRWDYIINSTPEHAESFAMKLGSTKSFKLKKINNSGLWAVKIIRH